MTYLIEKMDLKTIEISNQIWLDILTQMRHDVYHLPQYFRLEAQRTNTKPEACLIQEEGKIFFAPYLLRKCDDIVPENGLEVEIFDAISPYGYPGILINDAAANTPEFLKKAIFSFQEHLKSKNICSAFFRLHPIINEKFEQIFPQDIFTANGQTVSIDLSLSEEKLWAHTRKGHQSTINKCKRLGFTARVVSFRDYYDEFIAIYRETMNRVKASQTYYFNDDYFNGLLDLNDKLNLCIVELGEEIICASLFFESCGIMQAHLGGTKDNFIRQSPFNLLLHYMRLWGKERGNQYLHIGGGIGGSTDDTLFTFKSGFSRQRHKFLTFRLITDQDKYLYLVESKAKSLNIQKENLMESGFFPAYRANLSKDLNLETRNHS